jgi:hypothetical protein
MLAEVSLEALSKDYIANRNDVPLLSRLIGDRPQQIELLQIEARGLHSAGERLAAFDAYLRLADFTAEAPTHLRLDSAYSARSDRWIAGQLGLLWSEATVDERAVIAERLAERKVRMGKPRTAAELRHALAHLNELPGAGELRQSLIELLVDRRQG